MNLESIALIGVLTLLTLPLGAELFLLLSSYSTLDTVPKAAQTDLLIHIHQAAYRTSAVLILLLPGAIFLNITKQTRTEVYLLRIGLGALTLYTAFVLLASNPLSNQIINALDVAPATEVISQIQQWHETWQRWLWPCVLSLLVSFWAFLHYAMNPKA